MRANRFNARKANKEMHPDMMDNVWVLGKKKQIESNVLVVRLAAEQNSKKRMELRQAIVRNIVERNANARLCCVGLEMDGPPSWQVMMRSMKNNLNLR